MPRFEELAVIQIESELIDKTFDTHYSMGRLKNVLARGHTKTVKVVT